MYLSDGDVPFFEVWFAPIFSGGRGVRKKVILLEPVITTSEDGEILLDRVII